MSNYVTETVEIGENRRLRYSISEGYKEDAGEVRRKVKVRLQKPMRTRDKIPFWIICISPPDWTTISTAYRKGVDPEDTEEVIQKLHDQVVEGKNELQEELERVVESIHR